VDATFRAIADYGVAVVALVAVALFAWWVIRTWTADLRQTRDRALDISERQVIATQELTLVVRDLTEQLRRRRS